MSLLNQHWNTPKEGVMTGRVPAQLRLMNDTPLSREQYAGVVHAYKLFTDALRVSLGGFLSRDRVLPDGTRVRLVSNNGVDTVMVWPVGGNSAVQTLHTGIVISLFKVSGVLGADYYPFWQAGSRIDISKRAAEGGDKEFDILVQVDSKATLGPNSFEDGKVKFRLIPAGSAYGASGMYTIEKEGKKKWPESVTPWYSNGFVNLHPFRFNFPNIKLAINPFDPLVKVVRFWTVGFTATSTEFDPRKAKGWLFFLVNVDEVTFKVFARKVRGELDPVLGSSSYDAELECKEIASQTLADDIARFRYDMHLAWSGKNFTLAPTGEMYSGEVFSSISITGDLDAATAALTLVAKYTPENPVVPGEATTFAASGSGVETVLGTTARVWNASRNFSYSRTYSRLVPGEQDPWTLEWVRPPSIGVITFSKNSNYAFTYGAKDYLFTAGPQNVTWQYETPPGGAAPTNLSTNELTGVTTGTPYGGLYTVPSVLNWVYTEPRLGVFLYTITASLLTITSTRDEDMYDAFGVYVNTVTYGEGYYTSSGASTHFDPTVTWAVSETLTSTGLRPEDNFSITASQAGATQLGVYPTETTRVPLSAYSDKKLTLLNEDMSLGRVAGLFVENSWTTAFTSNAFASNTGMKTSLIVKMRDPLDTAAVPDVVIEKDAFCSRFPTALNFVNGIDNVAAGVGITTDQPFMGGYTLANYVTDNVLYINTPPMILGSGTDVLKGTRLGAVSVASSTYNLTEPTTSFTRAEFLATFGFGDDVFKEFDPVHAATITGVVFTQGLPPADSSSTAIDKKYMSGFTPFFENYEGHMYADPRTMSFIAAFAGAGRTDGIGDVLSAGSPLLRLYVGNKQGATPLEPLISAWTKEVNKGRASASPPLDPYPTYEPGELYIAWDGGVANDSSPLL